MKNTTSSIEKKAGEYLKFLLRVVPVGETEIYIARSDKSFQGNSFLDKIYYGYSDDRIPVFLEREGLFESPIEVEADHVGLGDKREETTKRRLLKYIDCTQKGYKEDRNRLFELPKGLLRIKFNRPAAEYWLEKKGFKMSTKNLPDNQNYYRYEEKQLSLLLPNRGWTTLLKLKGADKFRPVFESFYYLYHDGGKKFIDKDELLIQYKNITKVEIEWHDFIHRKSDFKNMTKGQEALRKRVIWEYDNKKKKYHFEILPSSEEFSDA